MSAAEFEEKEYETAALVELGAFGPPYRPVFSSGQVLEKILGYDAAADPHPTHPIWQVLALARPPSLRLLPSHWPHGVTPPATRLPRVPVSLLLQFKRPEYMRGAAAKQWPRWRKPYFRFTRRAHQHRVLLRIERSCMGQAVVRYAAPAFWTVAELEARHLSRSVLTSSGFVSPTSLASHQVWTYTQPGVKGFGNPDGARTRFETLDELFTEQLNVGNGVLMRLGSDDPYADHLQVLGVAAVDREPRLRADLLRWRRTVELSIPSLPEATVSNLLRYTAVQSLAHRLGATWVIAASDAEPAA